jgi:hypothetical protein
LHGIELSSATVTNGEVLRSAPGCFQNATRVRHCRCLAPLTPNPASPP